MYVMDERFADAGICRCCGGWQARPDRRMVLGSALGLAAFGVTAFPGSASATRHAATVEPSLHLPLDRGVAKPLALTLDACSGGFDVKILKALIEWRIPATIFVTGLWLARNAAALAQIMAHPDLFQLGNHGARHQAMILGDGQMFGQTCVATLDKARREVLEGAELIEKVSGMKPRWFRGATALYSPDLVPMIGTWGFRVAGYSLNGDAGASLSAQAVSARMARARAGDVIIAHINQPNRPSGAGVIAGVRQLVDQGFTFQTLDGAI